MKKTLLAFVTISLLFSSCKKDDKTLLKDQLISKKWYFKSAIINGSIAEPRPCELDDYMEFSAANTMTFNFGEVLCEPSDPKDMTYNYSIAADQKTISLHNEKNEDQILTVKSISATTLEFQISGRGDRETYTYIAK